ncbi:MAG: iron-sulfur cluster assembly scaffold protein [Hellea sp.]|jgi:NifU-like protein involved in Fe-S cluster formation
MLDNLYNTDILKLSANLKNERLENPDCFARRVSKLCGSWLEIDLKVDNGRVKSIALRVQACALGQSSAAILYKNIVNAEVKEVVSARNSLILMLNGSDVSFPSRFSELELLRGVSDYPARHTSTLLAFNAAVEALKSIHLE